jgi:hypothetical protein
VSSEADEGPQVADGGVQPAPDLEELRAGALLAPPAHGVDRCPQDLGDVVEREELVVVARVEGTSWVLLFMVPLVRRWPARIVGDR